MLAHVLAYLLERQGNRNGKREKERSLSHRNWPYCSQEPIISTDNFRRVVGVQEARGNPSNTAPQGSSVRLSPKQSSLGSREHTGGEYAGLTEHRLFLCAIILEEG